jgi:hypothetical protein
MESLDTINKILTTLITTFGSSGTVVMLVFIALGAFAWRKYNDNQKDKYVDMALAAKDETIKRLAEESRAYKILLFKT